MKLYFFLRYSPAEDYQSTLYLKIFNLKDISMLIRSNRVHEKRGKHKHRNAELSFLVLRTISFARLKHF